MPHRSSLDENVCVQIARSVLPFFHPTEVCTIGAITSQMCVTTLARCGSADLSRVDDRVLSAVAKWLRFSVIENVVEGIRSGIQNAFYTVDYGTKPHMTCEPLLKHLADGIQRLEREMVKEREERGGSYGRALTEQKMVSRASRQNEARRRLIRL